MLLSVVFRDPATGQYAIPGSSADPCPSYMERVEVRDGNHWASIEGSLNAKQREEAQRVFQQDREGFGEIRREMHVDLRNGVFRDPHTGEVRRVEFGNAGREFRDYALDQSREKEAKRRARDPQGKFSVRHYTEGHIRVMNEERMHEIAKGRRNG